MEQTAFSNIRDLAQVPVEADNSAIRRYMSMCFHCGNCKWTCLDQAGVLDRYSFAETGYKAVCIYCGQCAVECPGFAMSEREDFQKAIAAIHDEGKIVIASTSPSVRASISQAFGGEAEFAQGKLVSLLKELGFDYVLDTNFGADLTIMEEATELVGRIKNGGVLPQFTSCCPSWVRFAEIFYPRLLPHISTAKSPIAMQGAVIKTWFAKKIGIDPEKIVNVAVAPCTSKKYEITKEGGDAAGRYLGISGMRDMDISITTRELAQWAKSAGVDFDALGDAEFDSLSGTGAGAIFGSTGGVMEAALRTAYYILNGKNPPEEFLNLTPVRGLESVREATVDLGAAKVTVAVIHGTKNAGRFIDTMKDDLYKYQFIEVMTCPGGCSGGGGQPKGYVIPGLTPPKKRVDLLYERDRQMEKRLSHENPEIQSLYNEFLTSPCGELSHKLLHTSYKDRSGILKGE
jgi:NADP-reducing hydrogenase subunit HndD